MVDVGADMATATRSRTFTNLNPSPVTMRPAGRRAMPNRRLSLVQRNVTSCDFRDFAAHVSPSRDLLSGMIGSPSGNTNTDSVDSPTTFFSNDLKENAGGVEIQLSEYDRVEIWLDGHPEFVYDYFMRKATKRLISALLERQNEADCGTPQRTDFESDSTASGNGNPSESTRTLRGSCNSDQSLSDKAELRINSNLSDTDLIASSMNLLGFSKPQFTVGCASPSRKLSLLTFRRDPVAYARLQPVIPENSCADRAQRTKCISLSTDTNANEAAMMDNWPAAPRNSAAYETSHFVVGSGSELSNLEEDSKALTCLGLPHLDVGHRRQRADLSRKRSFEPSFKPQLTTSLSVQPHRPRPISSVEPLSSPSIVQPCDTSHCSGPLKEAPKKDSVASTDKLAKDTVAVKNEAQEQAEARSGYERELAESSRFWCDLLVDLCSSNDDMTRMSHRVALAVCQLVGCECASLFTVAAYSDADADSDGNAEADADTKRTPSRLICRALNVRAQTTLEQSTFCTDSDQQPLMIAVGPEGGLVGSVARTGEPIRLDDVHADERFNRQLDTGVISRSMLLMPIKTRGGELVGVAVATNKLKQPAAAPVGQKRSAATGVPPITVTTCSNAETGSTSEAVDRIRKQSVVQDDSPSQRAASLYIPFSSDDEQALGGFVGVCALALRNAALFEKSQLDNRRSEVLLELARCIFREQVELHTLIYKIMMYAQSISHCERCQLLLIDDAAVRDKTDPKMGMFSQVYDLSTDEQESGATDSDAPRFPISLVVSEYVATTGETVNVADLERDARFSDAVSQSPSNAAGTRLRIKSVLCMPIRNGQDEVIGVCVLANKLGVGVGEAAFERDDERFFEAFTLFCGLGIHQTKMYERAIRAVAKQRVALEVLSYHATASVDEALRLRKMHVPTARFYQLSDFSFSDFSLTDDDTLKCTLRMFIDLRLVEKFRIDYAVLCRFVLSVKKNYRNVTYHNWRHAFNVAQSMFSIVQTGAVDVLTDAERLGLLVACLCHDLDHRGTNNQFQIKSASALAQLYSTSVMEHHHFDQACMLLQAKGNEIFANLDSEALANVMHIIESAILATDLAQYFRERNNFFTLVDSKADFSESNNRATLRKMLMTACDVSAIYKPWEVQRRVAELVFSEFFEQGDLEKSELHLQPADMMDRDKKDRLPAMQVNFIDSICMPIYAALSKYHQRLSPMSTAVEDNRRNWGALAASSSSNAASTGTSAPNAECKYKEKVQA